MFSIREERLAGRPANAPKGRQLLFAECAPGILIQPSPSTPFPPHHLIPLRDPATARRAAEKQQQTQQPLSLPQTKHKCRCGRSAILRSDHLVPTVTPVKKPAVNPQPQQSGLCRLTCRLRIMDSSFSGSTSRDTPLG